MDGIPRLVVSIPLYIALPRHPVTRRKRYALVNANVERMGRNHARMKTQWTIVETTGAFQSNGDAVEPTAPSVPGVTTFMPANPLASPVYMFISQLEGRRIRPGLLVTVTVRQNLSMGQDSVTVDAIVEVNSGCQTGYSSEVRLEDMGLDSDQWANNVHAGDMDNARQEWLTELRTRAESIGPDDDAAGNNGDRRANSAGETHDGEVVADDGDRGSTETPVERGDSGGNDTSTETEVGRTGKEERRDPVAGKEQGVKDEHNIDDLYW